MILTTETILRRVPVVLLTGLLFLSPLVQGFFYPVQYLFGNFILSFVVVWFLIFERSDIDKLFAERVVKLIIMIVLLYAVSSLLADNISTAIIELFRLLPSFYCILIGFYLGKKEIHLNTLRHIFYSGFIVALVGIFAAVKPEVFQGAVFQERIQSTFQYANSLAIYMLICYFIGIYICQTLDNKFSYWNWFICCVLSFVLLLTFSRGVIFIYIFSIVFFLFQNPKEIVQKIWKPIAFTNLMVLLTIFLVAFIKEELPIQRVVQVSIYTPELQARVAYFIDAIKIIIDNPFLGIGGGNWASQQFQYQTTYYYVKMIHSQLLQMTVDAGIFAGVLFALVWCALFIRTNDIARKDIYFKPLMKTLVLAVGIHSLVDLDLAFPVIAYVFWLLVGITLSMTISSNAKPKGSYLKTTVLIAVISVNLLSLPFFLAEVNYSRARHHLQQQNYDKAIEYFANAIEFNPLAPEYYEGIGAIYEVLGVRKQDGGYFQLALNNYSSAIKRDPNSPKLQGRLAYLLFKLRRFDESAVAFERLVDIEPIKITHYENLSLSWLLAGEEEIRKNPEKAKTAFKKVIEVSERLELARDKITTYQYLASREPKNLVVTDRLKENIKKANAHLLTIEGR